MALLALILIALLSSQCRALPASNNVAKDCGSSSDCDWSQYWQLIAKVNISNSLPVAKYKSKRTGLTLVLSQADSPIVNGYFCLATEAFDNDGLPHTLEHLVFLGSEDYPYKGVLDLLANRCLADRTNAWTDTDHTCYTVYTAGSGGFLSILPIYMDHILHPLLRHEDFLTEVHHITGDGLDSGVVYSEMQAIENKDTKIIYNAMIHQLYPGNSSLESQTGGRLQNLRESTNIDKVRKYHKEFYRSENLYLTVTGFIEPEQIFAALDPVEKKVLRKREDSVEEPFKRPFTSDLDTLKSDINVTIQYPSNNEQYGRVSLGWRLPGKLWETWNETVAFMTLGSYLTSTAVSPMMSNFVELDNPMATDVDVDVLLNAETAVIIDFEDVPIDQMKNIEPKFWEVIRSLIDKGPKHFDSERMRTIIKRKILAHQMSLENSPHLVVPDPSVLDMLYGYNEEHFTMFMKKSDLFAIERLLDNDADYWLNLLNTSLSSPRVLVLAYPSIQLSQDIANQEAERLRRRAEQLGPSGLALAAAQIDQAVKSQVPPSSEVLLSIPMTDANSINFRKFQSYNYTSDRQPDGFDIQSIPFRFHLDDMNSEFVRAYLFLDTSFIPEEDYPYLVLLTELWFESPLRLPGSDTLESFESVTTRRAQTALSMSNELGYKGSTFTPGSYSHLILFYLEATMQQYEEAVQLLQQTLFHVEFTEDRARSVIAQLLQGIPSYRKSDSKVVTALFDDIFFKDNTVIVQSAFVRQQKFLEHTLELLCSNPGQVLSKLQSLKTAILRKDTVFGFMSTNLNSLRNSFSSKTDRHPEDVWKTFFDTKQNESVSFLTENYPTISEYLLLDPEPAVRHIIVNMTGSDSCHMKQGIVYDTTDWEDDSVAAVRVMLQYLSDRMYDQIRGQGWTYSVSMSSSVTEGRMRITFSRSSQFLLSYNEFRGIIANFSGIGLDEDQYQKVWDPVLLDSARGSQIYDWAEREETTEKLSSVSVKSYLRKTYDSFYNRRFVKKLSSVTMNDVQTAAKKYLPQFLDPELSHTAITCPPGEVDAIIAQFSHFKFDLTKLQNLDTDLTAQ